MSILDRLLFREVIKTLLVIVVILIAVLLANNVVRLLSQVASGALSVDVLATLVGFELLKGLGRILPPAFFFSILWVLGRMYRDSEMAALEASGVSIGRIYRSFMISAIPLAILVAWLVMSVLPWAKSGMKLIKEEQKNIADIAVVRPGRFNEFNRGGLVVYTRSLSGDGVRLQNVFVQDRQQGRLGLVTAESAYQTSDPETGDRYVVLRNGRRWEGFPGELDYASGSFGEYAIRIPKLKIGEIRISSEGKHWLALWNSDDMKDRTEWQYRLSFPMAIIAFALLSVPLARTGPRKDIYGRLSLAVLIYFSFMNLQRVAERLMKDGVTPLWLGMWWVPFLMVFIAALIIMLDSHWFAAKLRGLRGRSQ